MHVQGLLKSHHHTYEYFYYFFKFELRPSLSLSTLQLAALISGLPLVDSPKERHNSLITIQWDLPHLNVLYFTLLTTRTFNFICIHTTKSWGSWTNFTCRWLDFLVIIYTFQYRCLDRIVYHFQPILNWSVMSLNLSQNCIDPWEFIILQHIHVSITISWNALLKLGRDSSLSAKVHNADSKSSLQGR